MTLAQLYFDLVLDAAPDAVASNRRPRVGTDVQAVAPVLASLRSPLRDAYLRRLFTVGELADCGVPVGWSDGAEVAIAESLAARFAAKEAVVKILRPGGGGGPRPPWTDIELRRGAGGWPELALHDAAARTADAAGLTDWSVSFAHDDGLAVATVIAVVSSVPRKGAHVHHR